MMKSRPRPKHRIKSSLTLPTNNLESSVSAFVTIILFFFWSLLPEGKFDTIVNFVTPVVAILIVPIIQRAANQWKLPSYGQVLLGSTVSIIVMIAIPNTISFVQNYLQTRSGREARAIASTWTTVLMNDFEDNADGWWLHEDVEDYATSTRKLEGGQYILRLDSNKDVTAWAGSKIGNLQDFYVSVDITKVEGPENSYCGLIFRYQDPGNWLFFRLRSDQTFGISRNTGAPNHQQIAGPTFNKDINKDGTNRVSILARGDKYEFFVNDIPVYISEKLPITSGGIEMTVQAPQNPSIITIVASS